MYGWQVIDCVVTLTHTGYWPRQSHAHAMFDKSMSSTAGDFRNLTPLVLRRALAGPAPGCSSRCTGSGWRCRRTRSVPLYRCWPGCGAVPHTPPPRGPSDVLEGEIPAARVHGLASSCPALTPGEGVLETSFDHYEPVRGEHRSRARWQPEE